MTTQQNREYVNDESEFHHIVQVFHVPISIVYFFLYSVAFNYVSVFF